MAVIYSCRISAFCFRESIMIVDEEMDKWQRKGSNRLIDQTNTAFDM